MACISCGVITSAWLWRNSSRCESAMLRCNIGPVLAYPFLRVLYTCSFYVVCDDVDSGSKSADLTFETQPTMREAGRFGTQIVESNRWPATSGTLRRDTDAALPGR